MILIKHNSTIVGFKMCALRFLMSDRTRNDAQFESWLRVERWSEGVSISCYMFMLTEISLQ